MNCLTNSTSGLQGFKKLFCTFWDILDLVLRSQ